MKENMTEKRDKIAVNLLLRNPYRMDWMEIIFHYISKVKEENKKVLKLNFLCSYEEIVDSVKTAIDKYGFEEMETEVVFYPSLGQAYRLDYSQKMGFICETDCEYSIKWDEDFFINNYALDYIIENRHLLQDENNLTLCPLSSTGIPSSELFVDNYFDESDRVDIHDAIMSVSFPNIWGYDYSHLNSFTVDAQAKGQTWDGEGFYKAANDINYHYKGINPYRVSSSLQHLLNNKILQNPEKFLDKNEYEITAVKQYNCNHFCLIKSEDYKTILTDRSLYVDEFDEVPLNKYREMHDLNYLFVKGAYGVHPMYNTIESIEHSASHKHIIIDFVHKLFDIIFDGSMDWRKYDNIIKYQ